jgi:hypothetical protein
MIEKLEDFFLLGHSRKEKSLSMATWSIWKERNRHVHDRETLMPVALALAILDES